MHRICRRAAGVMIRCCTVLHRGGLQGHDAGSALAGLVGDLVAGEDLGALVYGGFSDGRHQRRATRNMHASAVW